jgi:hypothetical protein
MDRFHGKKAVASKKKEKTSENKIRPVKKTKGGGPYSLNNLDLYNYRDFIQREFTNYNNHNLLIKNNILNKINEYYHEFQRRRLIHNKNNQPYQYYIFYIYNTTDNEIISIGIISNSKSDINGKKYLLIDFLASRKKRNHGATFALYHILKRLPDKYAGVCLFSYTEITKTIYKRLGFIQPEHEHLFTLDKTQENINRLESKLPHPITTEFYSTYPDNQIT